MSSIERGGDTLQSNRFILRVKYLSDLSMKSIVDGGITQREPGSCGDTEQLSTFCKLLISWKSIVFSSLKVIGKKNEYPSSKLGGLIICTDPWTVKNLFTKSKTLVRAKN